MLKNLKKYIKEYWLKIVLEVIGLVLIELALNLDSTSVIEFYIGYVFLKIVIIFEIYEAWK